MPTIGETVKIGLMAGAAAGGVEAAEAAFAHPAYGAPTPKIQEYQGEQSTLDLDNPENNVVSFTASRVGETAFRGAVIGQATQETNESGESDGDPSFTPDPDTQRSCNQIVKKPLNSMGFYISPRSIKKAANSKTAKVEARSTILTSFSKICEPYIKQMGTLLTQVKSRKSKKYVTQDKQTFPIPASELGKTFKFKALIKFCKSLKNAGDKARSVLEVVSTPIYEGKPSKNVRNSDSTATCTKEDLK